MDDVDGTQPATSVAHSASMFRDVWRLSFGPMLAPISAVLWAYAGQTSRGTRAAANMFGDVLAVTFSGRYQRTDSASQGSTLHLGGNKLDSLSNFTFEGSSCRMATILCACA